MSKLFTFKDRVEIAFWLNDHGLTGAAAEIGCAFGTYARGILQRWRGQKYYMVDPFIAQPKDVYREETKHVNFDHYFQSCSRLARDDHRVQIIRKYSVDGAKDIPDGSLDWVWIDGNHAYPNVMQDLDSWYPKVKIGGVFSGHDYGLDTNYPHWCEVRPAVDRWMAEHQVEFEHDADPDSWWCLKTKEL